MHYPCPDCSQPIIWDENTSGRHVCCPKCKTEFRLPYLQEGKAEETSHWVFGGLALTILIALFTAQDHSAIEFLKPLQILH